MAKESAPTRNSAPVMRRSRRLLVSVFRSVPSLPGLPQQLTSIHPVMVLELRLDRLAAPSEVVSEGTTAVVLHHGEDQGKVGSR